MNAGAELWCDPSPGPGSGHLTRSLALVQAWVDLRGEVGVVDRGMTPAWRSRFSAEGARIAAEPESSAEVVVVDGYDAAPRAAQIRQARPDVVLGAIDDHGLSAVAEVDVAVDQNLGARSEHYQAETVLIGPDYVLLRREFRAVEQPPARELPNRPRLLLSAGAAPPAEVSSWLDEVALRLGDAVEPVQFRGVTDVPRLLATTDLAIAAAGSTTWELLWAGVPVAAFSWADNQRPVAEALRASGLGLDLGEWTTVTPEAAAVRVRALLGDADGRVDIANRGRRLVDGRGAERVAVQLRASLLDVREARPDDARAYFEWANDPLVRAASFSPEPISWSRHQDWFAQRLADPRTSLLIVQRGTAPVAQVRVESDGEGVGAIDVSAADRGRGWGAPSLVRAIRHFSAASSDDRLVAEIRLENEASLVAFERAGFTQTISERSDALRYDFVLHA